jgi:hypothetical protein
MCHLCLERRADLIAKAVAWTSRRDHEGQPLPEAISNQIVDSIIEGRGRHYCEGCGKRIPQYHNMQNCGFQSPSIHHYHSDTQGAGQITGFLEGVDKPVTFKVPVHLELCYECLVKDHTQVYPNLPPPKIANTRFD